VRRDAAEGARPCARPDEVAAERAGSAAKLGVEIERPLRRVDIAGGAAGGGASRVQRAAEVYTLRARLGSSGLDVGAVLSTARLRFPPGMSLTST
jgi:hypothetical protein